MSSTGIYGADAGSITFDGAEITRASSRAIYHAGMSRTFQRSRLSLPLSIFDNIMIGNHKRLNQGLWFNLVRRGAFKREFEANYRAARALVEVFEPQLAGRMFEPVAGLPMIDRRRIEICRALISQPKLLLLDEPSAGMTHEETKELMDDILQIRDAQQESHHRHRRARDGRDRAHHRPLRGAQFRPQDRGRPVPAGRRRPRRCRKPIWEWPR